VIRNVMRASSDSWQVADDIVKVGSMAGLWVVSLAPRLPHIHVRTDCHTWEAVAVLAFCDCLVVDTGITSWNMGARPADGVVSMFRTTISASFDGGTLTSGSAFFV